MTFQAIVEIGAGIAVSICLIGVAVDFVLPLLRKAVKK